MDRTPTEQPSPTSDIIAKNISFYKPVTLDLLTRVEKVAPGLDPSVVNMLASLCQEVIQEVVWEVVPDLAEELIKEHLAG